MTKQEAITLIQKIRELGDEDHARELATMVSRAYPEWELRQAFEAMKGEK
jgi:hypothetical protein